MENTYNTILKFYFFFLKLKQTANKVKKVYKLFIVIVLGIIS